MTAAPVTATAGGRMRLRDVPMILMYHAVADVATDPYRLAVSPRRFAEQLAWLERAGLRGVGVGELVNAMAAGRAQAGRWARKRPGAAPATAARGARSDRGQAAMPRRRARRLD